MVFIKEINPEPCSYKSFLENIIQMNTFKRKSDQQCFDSSIHNFPGKTIYLGLD